MKNLDGRWFVTVPTKLCKAPERVGMYQGNVLDILLYLNKKHKRDIYLFTESLLDGEYVPPQKQLTKTSIKFRVDFSESGLGDLTLDDLQNSDKIKNYNFTITKVPNSTIQHLLKVVC